MQIKSSILRLITASAIGFGLVDEANAQYTNTLTPDLKVTPDLAKPGFIWNVFANQANQINSRERTVDALAGRVTDALGVFGYSTKDNDDVSRWIREVPKLR